jgi:superoxide dismutase, Cu-Zn family
MKKALGAQIRLALLACVGAVAACTADGEPGVSEAEAGTDANGPVEGGTTSTVATGGGTDGQGGGAGGMAAGGTAGGGGAVAGTAGSGGTAGGGEPDARIDAGRADGADGDAGGEDGTKIIESTGVWFVFREPYGDGGVANPIPPTIMGLADAFELSGNRMKIKLKVTGLPANRVFESRLHKLMCEMDDAGGDYQNRPFPRDGSATDPAFSNSTNEAWLDLTTDADGTGSAETIVNWIPRPDQANAIIIHDVASDSGAPGASLACTNLPF